MRHRKDMLNRARPRSEALRVARDGSIALGLFTIVAGGSSLANGPAALLESPDRTVATVVLAVVFASGVAFSMAFLRHLRSLYAVSRTRRRR